MLTKMWIGLYLSLLQEVVYVIVVLNDHSYKNTAYETNSNPALVDIALAFELVTISAILLLVWQLKTWLTTPTCGFSFPSS